jgi:signal transduction histidine kinase
MIYVSYLNTSTDNLTFQLDTLIHLKYADLEMGKYRSAAETLGSYLEGYTLSIKDSRGNFSIGEVLENPICVQKSFATSRDSIQVALCKSLPTPYRLFGMSIFLYIVISTGILVLLRKIETSSLSNLIQRLKSLGVEIGPKDSFETVIESIGHIQEENLKAERIKFKIEEAELISKIARQVAHDIRSPLSALNLIAAKTEVLSNKEAKMIQAVTSRINRVAEDLLSNYSSQRYQQVQRVNLPKPSQNKFLNLNELTLAIKEEKLLQAQEKGRILRIGLEIDKDIIVKDSQTFSNIGRILSNLINNSLEACSHPNLEILIVARVTDKLLILQVSDNGPGMPTSVIENIGSPNNSVGKQELPGSGYGLGLSGAFDYLNSVNGTIEILSKENLGTTILLKFPLALFNQAATFIPYSATNAAI